MLRSLTLVVLSLGVSAAAAASVFTVGVACPGAPFGGVVVGIQGATDSCVVSQVPSTRVQPAGTAEYSLVVASADASQSGLRTKGGTFIDVSGARSGFEGGSSQAWAEWLFDDFSISGPPGTSVASALHLFVSGSMSGGGSNDTSGPLTSFTNGGGDFSIEIEIGGAFAGNGFADWRFNNGNPLEFAGDILAGHFFGGAISDIVTSDPLSLPVGGTFSVRVSITGPMAWPLCALTGLQRTRRTPRTPPRVVFRTSPPP